jgi:glycerate kinase
MADSRALLIAAARLDGQVLQATAAFELATRARQGGVPSYAITAANGLDSFQARILDLQLILEAGSPRALRDSAHALAAEVMAGLGS